MDSQRVAFVQHNVSEKFTPPTAWFFANLARAWRTLPNDIIVGRCAIEHL